MPPRGTLIVGHLWVTYGTPSVGHIRFAGQHLSFDIGTCTSCVVLVAAVRNCQSFKVTKSIVLKKDPK